MRSRAEKNQFYYEMAQSKVAGQMIVRTWITVCMWDVDKTSQKYRPRPTNCGHQSWGTVDGRWDTTRANAMPTISHRSRSAACREACGGWSYRMPPIDREWQWRWIVCQRCLCRRLGRYADRNRLKLPGVHGVEWGAASRVSWIENWCFMKFDSWLTTTGLEKAS